MKTVYRTYKFRMYPNAEQRQVLARYFGSVRFIYNHYLAQRKEQYEQTGRSDNYSRQTKDLVSLKRTEGYEWLKEINSQTLQQTLMHLDTAYGNFFRKQTQFPKFKSRKRGGSFTVPQFCSIQDGYVHIPKFKEGLKVKEHRKVKGTVKSMTISLPPTGKYYVSILTEEQYEPMPRTNASVGLDMGLKSLVITSEGETYDNNRYTKKYEHKLATAQKHLSRKQKDSNGWERQRMKVDRYYPSSKTCSKCGYVYADLRLAERSWTCPDCGTKHDRDINAAVNIWREGLRVSDNPISAGTVDYTGGDGVRPATAGCRLRSQKPKSL